MKAGLILASGSQVRKQLLQNAGVSVDVRPARVDEDAIRESLIAAHATPRDVADQLADAKARKSSSKVPQAFVLGCDQILDFGGTIINKAETPVQALETLQQLNGQAHTLYSAAVIYQDRRPIWRHVGKTTLRMRHSSTEYLKSFVDRNWDVIRHSVGCYTLEGEGVRLFHKTEGDYFNVLGLPLLEVLAFLTLRGVIDG